jgi:MarR-like DNA-binding transcriptional regulator SgrR of sgrS sRNA
MGEEMADSILRTTCEFHGKCTNLLHAAKLRHGTDGFTFPPKEGMLRIFVARKIRRLQPDLNQRTSAVGLVNSLFQGYARYTRLL